ncbi:MAG: MFS transporter [Lentisphaerae bacterium]|jgi:MFS family permease|nr:MFS transporter [Lentisphaerota bacterium]MBT5604787.1 MFS transporter [Lentisphaerota bacterium]MBT7057031.1 MFS transporter [Lentisphaerota bacterium]MBT7845315.1 MFS transporter [Lentisphaerota bacterium]
MSCDSQERLPATETRKGLRFLLAHAAFFGTWYTVGMPANPFIAGYALNVLGMTPENAGLIGTSMYASAIFQFLSFALTNRIRDRKRFVLLVWSGEMVFLGLALLLPFLLGTGNSLAWAAFFALLFVSGTCLNLIQPIFGSWLSAIIPSRIRGRYLGTRQLLITGMQTVGIYLGTQVVDRWPQWQGFAVVFLAGCLTGLTALWMLSHVPMPRVSQDSRFRLADLRGAFRPGPFRRYLVYSATLFAGFSLACGYYAPFFLSEIGLSFRQVGWYRIGHNVLMLLVLRPGGRLVDRLGARPVVILMTLIYMVFFALFPLFSAQRYWLIVVAWAGVGIADGLFWVALTSTLYHSLPTGPERTGYLALAQGMALIYMGVGPFIVRGYLGLAKGIEFDLLGAHFEPFRLMFFACSVLMLGAAVAATQVENTRDVRFGPAAMAMLRALPFRLLPRLWQLDDSE